MIELSVSVVGWGLQWWAGNPVAISRPCLATLMTILMINLKPSGKSFLAAYRKLYSWGH
jgi:cytochrome c biogenesis factor